MRNPVLRSLLLIEILWIERLLINRLFLIDLGTDPCCLLINVFEWFKITSYHLLDMIYFFWVHTWTNITRRSLLTLFIYRFCLLNLRNRIWEIRKSVDLIQIAMIHSIILGWLQWTSLFSPILIVNILERLVLILLDFSVGIWTFLLIWEKLELFFHPMRCGITSLLWTFCVRHNL